MKNKKLADALSQIDDDYITDAAAPQKSRRPWYFAAIAAVLVLIFALSLIPWQQENPGGTNIEHSSGAAGGTENSQNATGTQQPPATTDAPPVSTTTPPYAQFMLASPSYPALTRIPRYEDFGTQEAYQAAYEAWWQGVRAQYDQPDGYADSLDAFFARSIGQFLSGEENSACSPLSVYLALAMLAETTGGNSRQQILDLLGLDSIEQLRTQANHVWNAHYCADGRSDLLLTTSLWMDEEYSFNRETVENLAEYYHAYSFRGNLGSEEMNEQLRLWLNSHTGDMLCDQMQNLSMDPETVFALASTVFFAAKWQAPFSEKNTKDDIFHTPQGDQTVSFLNKTCYGYTYYWGSNFSAIRLELSGEQKMWLILPDEGVTVEEVLAGGEYLEMTLSPNTWQSLQHNSIIHLSVPKFDVSADLDLAEGLQALGITDVFDPAVADFSPLTSTPWLSVTSVRHAVRIAIDEEGCVGAAYTMLMVAGAVPPEGEIYLELDRPFVFVVTSSDNLPIFAGTVMNP